MAVKTDDPKKNAVKVDGKPRLSNPFNKRTDIPIEGIITVQGKPDDNYPGFVAPTMAVKGEATDRILGDPNAVKSGPINPHNIGLVIGFPADAIVGREMTGAQIEVDPEVFARNCEALRRTAPPWFLGTEADDPVLRFLHATAVGNPSKEKYNAAITALGTKQ